MLEQVIAALLARGGEFSSVEAAAGARVSRQAAHKALVKLEARGAVERSGAGRTARWRASRGGEILLRFPLRRLAAERVWSEHFAGHPAVRKLGARTRELLAYAAAELLGNAVDHAGGSAVLVRFTGGPSSVALEVTDDGAGLFQRLQRGLKLPGLTDAAAELTKGRVTTDPARHAGQGIFFTARAALRFRAESDDYGLLVDNAREDISILELPPGYTPARGTRIIVEIARRPKASLEELVARYTDGFAFARTEVVVKLFEHGREFVSRAEARRLLEGLERFVLIELDFSEVRGIGQGFADEVFRVWARAHPKIALKPVRMNAPVAFMVRRAGGKKP